jgi:hypothetical protein
LVEGTDKGPTKCSVDEKYQVDGSAVLLPLGSLFSFKEACNEFFFGPFFQLNVTPEIVIDPHCLKYSTRWSLTRGVDPWNMQISAEAILTTPPANMM